MSHLLFNGLFMALWSLVLRNELMVNYMFILFQPCIVGSFNEVFNGSLYGFNGAIWGRGRLVRGS